MKHVAFKKHSKDQSSPHRQCQICGKAAIGSYKKVLTCAPCQKFWQRHSRCQLSSLKCNVGRPINYSWCDLTVDRRPCKKCRLEKMRFLAAEHETAPSPSIDEETPSVEEVEKMQNKLILRRRLLAASSPESIPVEPSHFEFQINENILQRVMAANRDFVSAKYIYTYEYLMATGGIPKKEEQMWMLIGESVADIVRGYIPFARQLAGDMIDSPADMCRLIDASYWLMYCVQSGIIATTDVVSAYGILFTGMLKHWPELGGMMECAKHVVDAIRIWKPDEHEFAFLMSLIFCKSIGRNGGISPRTISVLEHLAEVVTNSGKAYVTSKYGEMRWKQLVYILSFVVREQEIRCHAIRPFKQRTPGLAHTIVRPVCSVVCREFASTWNIDTSSDEELTWPAPYNSPYIPRSNIDQMVNFVLDAF